jgi:membrane peptidoglycan carboxypeptidase
MWVWVALQVKLPAPNSFLLADVRSGRTAAATKLALLYQGRTCTRVRRREWLIQAAALGATSLSWAEERPPSDLSEGDSEQAPEPPVAPVLDLDTLAHDGQVATCKTTMGNVAKLTLDVKLQQCANDLLRGAHPLTGAAILVNARTGRVMAFSNYVRGQRTTNPLTTGAPAASIFKLVTTAALLEGGKVTPKTRVCFSGGERQIE